MARLVTMPGADQPCPTDRACRRGRQAEAARNDRRVLDAAREVFTTQGFGAPVAAVAARAGVGMGSLYRRYGSKEELCQRLCVLAMEQAIEAADAALADPDPWHGLAAYIAERVSFGSGAFSPLAGTISASREMWETARRARERHELVVARAHRAGVLRRDATPLDVTLLIEQFGRRAPGAAGPDPNTRDRLLAIALAGLRTGDSDPLPGDPPDWTDYESRWQR
jgi:AcrR family transcriptional regulator